MHFSANFPSIDAKIFSRFHDMTTCAAGKSGSFPLLLNCNSKGAIPQFTLSTFVAGPPTDKLDITIISFVLTQSAKDSTLAIFYEAPSAVWTAYERRFAHYNSRISFHVLDLASLVHGTCLADIGASLTEPFRMLVDGTTTDTSSPSSFDSLPAALPLAILRTHPGIFIPSAMLLVADLRPFLRVAGDFSLHGCAHLSACDALGWREPLCWHANLVALWHHRLCADALLTKVGGAKPMNSCRHFCSLIEREKVL